MKNTLLSEFIKKMIADYEEPQRKGTPKGEPVGFGRDKYKASLYLLYNTKLVDLAEELNISYGVFRKWKSEKVVQAEVENYLREFTDVFWNYVVNLNNESCVDKKEIPFSNLKVQHKKISDFYRYSLPLVKVITKRLEHEMAKTDDDRLSFTINSTMSYLRFHEKNKLVPPVSHHLEMEAFITQTSLVLKNLEKSMSAEKKKELQEHLAKQLSFIFDKL